MLCVCAYRLKRLKLNSRDSTLELMHEFVDLRLNIIQKNRNLTLTPVSRDSNRDPSFRSTFSQSSCTNNDGVKRTADWQSRFVCCYDTKDQGLAYRLHCSQKQKNSTTSHFVHYCSIKCQKSDVFLYKHVDDEKIVMWIVNPGLGLYAAPVGCVCGGDVLPGEVLLQCHHLAPTLPSRPPLPSLHPQMLFALWCWVLLLMWLLWISLAAAWLQGWKRRKHSELCVHLAHHNPTETFKDTVHLLDSIFSPVTRW